MARGKHFNSRSKGHWRRRFVRFAGITLAAIVVLNLLYWPVLRPWHLGWGATEQEVGMIIPGDNLVPDPRQTYTRAVTINALPSDVWPWIVQIGQGRGGFYSYEWMENLAGCQIRNVYRIMPELQDLKAGDGIRLHPKIPPIPVVAIDPDRALVLGGVNPQTGSRPIPAENQKTYFYNSWVFYLYEKSEGTTRLIARGRGDYNPNLSNFIIWKVITEPANFVMERKMLLTIKSLVEKNK